MQSRRNIKDEDTIWFQVLGTTSTNFIISQLEIYLAQVYFLDTSTLNQIQICDNTNLFMQFFGGITNMVIKLFARILISFHNY